MSFSPKNLLQGVVLAGASLLLAACNGQNAAPPPPTTASGAAVTLPSGLAPAASVLDLMNESIVPLSNAIWMADNPDTDEQWEALRGKALMLMEAANLLAIDARPVAREGQSLKEPGGEGDLTPAQSQAAIEANRAAFTGMAASLQMATRSVIDAIDRKDADAYLDAGGAIDEACESCHTSFWYPNATKPAN